MQGFEGPPKEKSLWRPTVGSADPDEQAASTAEKPEINDEPAIQVEERSLLGTERRQKSDHELIRCLVCIQMLAKFHLTELSTTRPARNTSLISKCGISVVSFPL